MVTQLPILARKLSTGFVSLHRIRSTARRRTTGGTAPSALPGGKASEATNRRPPSSTSRIKRNMSGRSTPNGRTTRGGASGHSARKAESRSASVFEEVRSFVHGAGIGMDAPGFRSLIPGANPIAGVHFRQDFGDGQRTIHQSINRYEGRQNGKPIGMQNSFRKQDSGRNGSKNSHDYCAFEVSPLCEWSRCFQVACRSREMSMIPLT